MDTNAGRKKTIMTRGLFWEVRKGGWLDWTPSAQHITYVSAVQASVLRSDKTQQPPPAPRPPGGSDNEAPQLTGGQPCPQNSRVTPDISRPSRHLHRPVRSKDAPAEVGPRRAAGPANSRDTHFSRSKRGSRGGDVKRTAGLEPAGHSRGPTLGPKSSRPIAGDGRWKARPGPLAKVGASPIGGRLSRSDVSAPVYYLRLLRGVVMF